jgi:transposase
MKIKKRSKLILKSDERARLEEIIKSRKLPYSLVRRAIILLRYNKGHKISEIAQELKTNRPLIERCIDKAMSYGVLQALKDLPRSGRPVKITNDAKSWVLSIACQKPFDLGYAAELWTYSLLIKHIRKHCKEVGYNCLSKLGKGRLNAILSKSGIKPHKISYYIERRDPEFEEKMANLLCLYKEVELINADSEKARKNTTISYDEKPGIQAIKNIAPQLLPVPGKYSSMNRDYEYKRLGTVSLLAGIDLHTGLVIPLVKNRHRSVEFIEFLDHIDNEYPRDWKIRIILDNHSSHISKQTKKYLSTKTGRVEFFFSPKQGSWLNLIESFFSKIAHSFLRHIRVQSKKELIHRIYKGISEINEEPVIFKWTYKMDEIKTI